MSKLKNIIFSSHEYIKELENTPTRNYTNVMAIELFDIRESKQIFGSMFFYELKLVGGGSIVDKILNTKTSLEKLGKGYKIEVMDKNFTYPSNCILLNETNVEANNSRQIKNKKQI